jgi:hypothetical protein
VQEILADCFFLTAALPTTIVAGKSFGVEVGNDRVEVLGIPPSQPAYSLRRDLNLHGALLTAVQFAVAVFQGRYRELQRPLPPWEHNVLHKSRTGSATCLTDNIVRSHISNSVVIKYGIPFPTPAETSGYNSLVLDELGHPVHGPTTVPVGQNLLVSAGILSDLADDSIHQLYKVGAFWKHVWLSNYSYSFGETFLTMRYTVRTRNWTSNAPNTGGKWIQWFTDYSVRFSIDQLSPSDDGSLAVTLNRDLSCQSRGPYSKGSEITQAQFNTWYAQTVALNRWDPFNFKDVGDAFLASTVSTVTDVVTPAVQAERFWARDSALFSRYWNNIEGQMSEITPSSYFSTKDALQKYIQVLRTNHLETLAELSNILGWLPDLRPLMTLLLGPFSSMLDAGARFLDVLAAAKLYDSFVLKPGVASVREFGNRFDSIVDRLSGIGGREQTLNGKFIFSLFQDMFIVRDPFLTTRTKIHLTFPRSSVVNLIIGSGAVGLLPSLSNFWDIVPSSFVADWFTNVGGRLESIDLQAILFTVQIHHCVHSYTITGSVPDDYYTSTRTVLHNDPLAVRYYQRELSRFAPILRESKIDFQQAGGPSDWGTAGSFAWTRLR